MSRVGATIDVRGVAENWVAPVATFDAARAFGEEVWIDAVENTAILWTSDGFEIGCEFGPRRGAVSTPFASTMVMQPRGTPNRYWSAGPIRFGQLHVTESLLVRVADALESSLTGSDQLRDDLVFFHDPAFFNDRQADRIQHLKDDLVIDRDRDFPRQFCIIRRHRRPSVDYTVSQRLDLLGFLQ